MSLLPFIVSFSASLSIQGACSATHGVCVARKMLLCPFEGFHACELVEIAIERLLAGEAGERGDGDNLRVACVLRKQQLGMFHPQAVDIVRERHSL